MSQAGGFCEQCHERCPIHTYWYYAKGSGCKKCKEDEERRAKAAHNQREREKNNNRKN